MYKKLFRKYCEKLKYLSAGQIGGAPASSDDYIFDLSNGRYPAQLDFPQNDLVGDNSWFFCPVIWIALDRLYDENNNTNVRRIQILTNIGRPENGIDNMRFFGNLENGWIRVISAYDAAKKNVQLFDRFNEIIDKCKYFFKRYNDDMITRFLLGDSWHINTPTLNHLVQSFCKDFDFCRYPRENFGNKLKFFLIESIHGNFSTTTVSSQQRPISTAAAETGQRPISTAAAAAETGQRPISTAAAAAETGQRPISTAAAAAAAAALARQQRQSSATALSRQQRPSSTTTLPQQQRPSSATALPQQQRPSLTTALPQQQRPSLTTALPQQQRPSSTALLPSSTYRAYREERREKWRKELRELM